MEKNQMEKLSFASDYMEGAHPLILQRLTETNMIQSPGYGADSFSESARRKIREACQSPEAEIYFLAGGTQTNSAVITSMLRPWEGVLSASTGHISAHEAGAVEHGGHKVLPLPHSCGKITAADVRSYMLGFEEDENHDHMVFPGMVYISQPTEYGTLYSLEELTALSHVCSEFRLALYVDGARLAYALACPENDVFLPDLARLCSAFYIGGTKCGALFGEALVFPVSGTVPHFFTFIKQHGALLAKGRIAGLQFDTLFTDGLYTEAGRNAIASADRIRRALKSKNYDLPVDSPTNQIFIRLEPSRWEVLSRDVDLSFWEKTSDGKIILRIATSWATRREDVDRLIDLL